MMKQTLMMMAIMATMPLTILAEDKDTTVVIPETGHLAVKTSRNIFLGIIYRYNYTNIHIPYYLWVNCNIRFNNLFTHFLSKTSL